MATGRAKTLAFEVRLDIRSVAQIVRYYSTTNVRFRSRSNLITVAIDDFAALLCKNGLSPPINTAEEAFETLEELIPSQRSLTLETRKDLIARVGNAVELLVQHNLERDGILEKPSKEQIVDPTMLAAVMAKLNATLSPLISPVKATSENIEKEEKQNE